MGGLPFRHFNDFSRTLHKHFPVLLKHTWGRERTGEFSPHLQGFLVDYGWVVSGLRAGRIGQEELLQCAEAFSLGFYDGPHKIQADGLPVAVDCLGVVLIGMV